MISRSVASGGASGGARGGENVAVMLGNQLIDRERLEGVTNREATTGIEPV
jgi:hypothetical protein